MGVAMIYTAADIAGALARVDDMLRDVGVPAQLGACKCLRCETRYAPAEPVQASDAPDPTGGTLVAKPAPAPRAPRPGGIAVAVPQYDEIAF
jgi:hypothetical protein